MFPTVKDIESIVSELAPPELAEPWDNGGLLAGYSGDSVSGILVTLDITEAVVHEAIRNKLSMIVSHHPILFDGTKTLNRANAQGRLAHLISRHDLAVYSAHTALDLAPGGVCDAFAEQIGLSDIEAEGSVRIGNWIGESREDLLLHVRNILHTSTARLYGDPKQSARRVACVPGSGMDYAAEAIRLGADVFVTGDVRHHDALDAAAEGMAVIDAGHLPTERIAAEILFDGLQKRFHDIKCNIRVKMSEECPFVG